MKWEKELVFLAVSSYNCFVPAVLASIDLSLAGLSFCIPQYHIKPSNNAKANFQNVVLSDLIDIKYHCIDQAYFPFRLTECLAEVVSSEINNRYKISVFFLSLF